MSDVTRCELNQAGWSATALLGHLRRAAETTRLVKVDAGREARLPVLDWLVGLADEIKCGLDTLPDR